MAHGLKTKSSLKIHQSLHGYADGHRQLAKSRELAPQDAKRMLVLSDLSGVGARPDKEGYLTGYPLADSKLYAIARTWAAPELPRPGCVWTHTLLIDFGDLAPAGSIDLLSLFRRPTLDSLDSYRRALEVEPRDLAMALPQDAQSYARLLIGALYTRPKLKIVLDRPPSGYVDSVVLSIWCQQWPRLKRNFRFCTFAAADRSTETSGFDLQLVPSFGPTIRNRFSASYYASDEQLHQPWLDDAVSDLIEPDRQGLRTFLRKVGSDIDSGRMAFGNLCRLHRLIADHPVDQSSLEAAIRLVEHELATSRASSARGLVASAALENLERRAPSLLQFVADNVDTLSAADMKKYGQKLGREIWKYDPTIFEKSLLGGADHGRSIALGSLSSLDLEELSEGILRKPDVVEAILPHRPDLLRLSSMWELEQMPTEAAFSIISDETEFGSEAITALFLARRDGLEDQAIRHLGIDRILGALGDRANTSNFDTSTIRKWVRRIAPDRDRVASFLAHASNLSWRLLSEIAAAIPPDGIPNRYGTDPWLNAILVASESEPGEIPVDLAAYLLARALGTETRSPGELAAWSLQRTYEAASRSRLSDEAWSQLQFRLPWAWFDWDRCARIRYAISDLFIERDLAPKLFVEVCKDDQLFELLVGDAATRGRGERYLEKVWSWTKKNRGYFKREGVLRDALRGS